MNSLCGKFRQILKVGENSSLKGSRLLHDVADSFAHSLHATEQRPAVAWDWNAVLLQSILNISRPAGPTPSDLLRAADHRNDLHSSGLPLGKLLGVRHIIRSRHAVIESAGPSASNAQLTTLNGGSDRSNAATVGKEQYVLSREVILESLYGSRESIESIDDII